MYTHISAWDMAMHVDLANDNSCEAFETGYVDIVTIIYKVYHKNYVMNGKVGD